MHCGGVRDPVAAAQPGGQNAAGDTADAFAMADIGGGGAKFIKGDGTAFRRHGQQVDGGEAAAFVCMKGESAIERFQGGGWFNTCFQELLQQPHCHSRFPAGILSAAHAVG